MEMTYRRAVPDDVELLANIRVRLTDENAGLTEDEKTSLYASAKEFMQNAMQAGDCFAYLAFEGETFAGTCSVCLYRVLPSKRLQNGKNAYIQNVYVAPSYRKQGIGQKLVSMSMNEAIEKGYKRISLHATKMGAALFSRCGFQTKGTPGLSEMVFVSNR